MTNNKIRVLALSLSAVLLLSSCAVKADSKVSSSSSASSTGGGSSGTELVWVTTSQMLQSDTEIYKQFNTLIAQKGCDFSVKFEGIDTGIYAATLKKMKSTGEQADIIFSNLGYGDDKSVDSAYSSYYDNVKNGYYTLLDTYLSTAEGQKLYQAYDERCFAGAKINGKIYAVGSSGALATCYTWQFNKELLQKYKIDSSKFSDNLWDMSDVLQTVYEGEKSDADFGALYLPNGGDIISPFYDTQTSAVGVLNTDTSCKAVNLFSQAGTIKYLETLKQFRAAGYLKSGTGDVDNFFMTSGGYSNGNISQENTVVIPSGNKATTIQTSFKPISEGYIKSENFRFVFSGIAAWSKNKDQAFRLLTLVDTDADVSNLLAYGINNRDYVLKDGYAEKPGNSDYSSNLLSTIFFSNSLINYPNKSIGIYKGVDYVTANKKLKASPILGFFFDETSVKKEVAATDAVVAKYSNEIWNGDEANADTTLSQMQSELKAAGIDKVVNEVNRQITAWKKSK